MRVQQTVRDRDLSLQQSAIHQALAGNDSMKREEKENIELTASRRAQTIAQAKSEASAPSTVGGGAPSPPAGGAADAMLGPLRNWTRQYSTWDTRWIKPVWLYFKYYVISRLPPTYRNWRGYIRNDLDFGIIKHRLPSRCKVLLIGDWGTHMPDNAALLRQAVKQFEPQAIIHLGDVYYSGTVEECTANVLNVMDETYKEIKPRPPFFAIPGNHDYYSGGKGFYYTIDTVNSGIPDCKQEASFFCLRTEDDRWQFLGMDTGYNDRVPTDQLINPEGPDLHDDEMDWHKDKLEKFPGSTILLSHNQLISAKEQLSRQAPHYLNKKLYDKFAPYFDRVSAWYWGHEHSLILFEDDLAIEPGKPALKKGRLLGCSAYEENVSENPFAQKYVEARFIKDMKQLGQSAFKTGGASFYNHAFAVLEIAPEQITATCYEYPSWGLDNPQSPDPPIGDSYHPETLSPRNA
jgi:hypothetical protein